MFRLVVQSRTTTPRSGRYYQGTMASNYDADILSRLAADAWEVVTGLAGRITHQAVPRLPAPYCSNPHRSVPRASPEPPRSTSDRRSEVLRGGSGGATALSSGGRGRCDARDRVSSALHSPAPDCARNSRLGGSQHDAEPDNVECVRGVEGKPKGRPALRANALPTAAANYFR